MDMNAEELTGVYTYRSMLNRPEPVGDFNKIRFAEAEVYLFVRPDGSVNGSLSFPADPDSPEKNFLDLSGRVIDWNPVRLRLTGRGRSDTDVSDYVYDYEGAVAPTMSGAVDQQLTIAGTVIRSQDHGDGEQIARAGVTASFLAVKRAFVEPRDVPGVGLIEPARNMLANRVHRLHHTVWHTLRGEWWETLSKEDREAVAKLNWPLERPPFTEQGALDLLNGAGEDFLFMHRRMIAMVRRIYNDAGVPAPTGWTDLPSAGTPQFAYAEQPDPTKPERRTYTYDPATSGFMVPPATAEYLSIFINKTTQATARTRQRRAFLKTPEFFDSVMRQHEQLFGSPAYLASLSLGALGNLLEFTIHNQMHMRWATVPRDPVTGTVGPRPDFDVDVKWDNPRYDWLGDFYSSHVNPVFWKLHGWVDDRIKNWFDAHEAAHPGAVRRRTYKGVEWFDAGEWVATDSPFDQPEWWDHDHHGHDHHGGGSDQQKIDEMLAVLDIIRRADERQRAAPAARAFARDSTRGATPGLTSFARALLLDDESETLGLGAQQGT